MPQIKKCGGCNKTKSRKEFTMCITQKDGLSGYCKDCRRRVSKKHLNKLKRRNPKDITRPKTKRCNSCGKTKLAKQFYKNIDTKKGLSVYCKKCDWIRNRKYKKYYDQYRRDNRNRLNREGRKRYRDNKYREHERGCIYRQKNKEKDRTRHVIYYQKNKEKIALSQIKYYEKSKKYRDNDRIRSLVFAYSVYKKYNFRCVICGKNKELRAHHLIPKSKLKNEEKYNIVYGICLCKKCHKKYHSIYGNKNSNFKCFLDFLKLNNKNIKIPNSRKLTKMR